LIDSAYEFIRDQVGMGKKVLFVGTKKQAEEAVKNEALRCGMYYVNSRWLGGTLTNFETIRSRVDRLNKLHQMEKMGEFAYLPKKEVIKLLDERDKLERYLRGIADMTTMPGVMVVVDSKKEQIAIKEARKLGIPVVGIIDTNCDPDDVDVIIPANDDAVRSINLIVTALADAVIEAKEGVELRARTKDDNVSMSDVIKSKEVMQQAEAKDVEEEEVEEEKPVKKPAVKKEAPAVVAEEKPKEAKPKKVAEKKPAAAKTTKPAAKKEGGK